MKGHVAVGDPTAAHTAADATEAAQALTVWVPGQDFGKADLQHSNILAGETSGLADLQFCPFGVKPLFQICSRIGP